mgnify:CR=1 FL=1
MRIHRSILDYDMFRHPYTEGGKIPKSLDSSLDNPVCHLLRFLHRHGDHPDRRAIFFLLGRKIIHMKNGNAIDHAPVQILTDIKARHDLQTILAQSGVMQQRSAQTPYPKQKCLMLGVKPRKSSSTSTNALISYPTLVFPEIFTKERSLAT